MTVLQLKSRSLSFKKQVDRIILISGDSDFVPAAKQARREGIDFILDPMRSPIKDDLFEHIDGMRTKAPKMPVSPKTPLERLRQLLDTKESSWCQWLHIRF